MPPSSWHAAKDDEVQAVVTAAATTLQDLDATLVEIEVPEVTDATADWPSNCAVEAAVAHEVTFPARATYVALVASARYSAGSAPSCPLCMSSHTRSIMTWRRCAPSGSVSARAKADFCAILYYADPRQDDRGRQFPLVSMIKIARYGKFGASADRAPILSFQQLPQGRVDHWDVARVHRRHMSPY